MTEAAKEKLASAGFVLQFGARPLKRAIQREIQDPLAMEILEGHFMEGDTIIADKVDVGNRLLHFEKK